MQEETWYFLDGPNMLLGKTREYPCWLCATEYSIQCVSIYLLLMYMDI